MIRLMLDLIRKDGGSISLLGREAADVNASVRDDIGVVLEYFAQALLLYCLCFALFLHLEDRSGTVVPGAEHRKRYRHIR